MTILSTASPKLLRAYKLFIATLIFSYQLNAMEPQATAYHQACYEQYGSYLNDSNVLYDFIRDNGELSINIIQACLSYSGKSLTEINAIDLSFRDYYSLYYGPCRYTYTVLHRACEQGDLNSVKIILQIAGDKKEELIFMRCSGMFFTALQYVAYGSACWERIAENVLMRIDVPIMSESDEQANRVMIVYELLNAAGTRALELIAESTKTYYQGKNRKLAEVLEAAEKVYRI